MIGFFKKAFCENYYITLFGIGVLYYFEEDILDSQTIQNILLTSKEIINKMFTKIRLFFV